VIEKVRMKNFRSHEDSEIELTPGLNIFLGEVGAGKTSILEAISFGLFGRYAGSVNQSGLIRRGTEKAEISVCFSSSTDKYQVVRTISAKKVQKATMSVYSENEWRLAVEGATAVSKSVEDILNVDASTFLAAIYASQSEIKEMLETQPGKRRERLDKLLGLDRYEKIWKTLGEAEHIVLTELTDAMDQASGVNAYEKQLNDIQFKITKGEKELSDLNKSLLNVTRKFKPTEEKLKELILLQQNLTKMNIQVKGKSEERDKLKKSIELLRDKQKKAKKASRIFERNKQFIDLEINLRENQKRVELTLQNRTNLLNLLQRDKRALQLENERRNKIITQLKGLKNLEKTLRILEGERKALPTLIDKQTELQSELDTIKTKLIKSSSEIDNQKQKVKRVVELGECPTCLQIVPEEHKERVSRETHKIITQYEEQYSTLLSQNDKGSQRYEALKRHIERAEAADRKYFERNIQVKTLEERQEECKDVEDRIKKIETSISKSQNMIKEIEETPQTLKKLTTRLETISLKANRAREAELQAATKSEFEMMLQQEEDKRKKVVTQLATYRKLEKKLTKRYNVEELVTVEELVKTLREERAKIIEGMSRLERTMNDDKQQVQLLTTLLDEKKKAQSDVKQFKNERNIIDTLRHSLRQVIQPVMRKNNILRVSEAFQRFYQALSNDIIDSASIDEEGNIDIIRNGEPSPVNSLSGGETTCASLALRLAISSSLTKNQLLLLDEPTIHLDESYRAKLRDFLGDHRFEQLVVVTHDNTFDSLPAKIFRVQKRRGDSVVIPLTLGGS
jgi:exonuclease SbcC